MDISNVGSMKTKLKSERTTGTFSPVAIPTSTPHCVIVKSYKAPLPKSIATVKSKIHFDEDFPLFLRGQIDEEEFKSTIDGINWITTILHDAEMEYFSEKFSVYEVWKSYRETLMTEESRRKQIKEILSKEGIEDATPFRERIKSEKALKAFYEKGSKWLQAFIEDENNRIYLNKGVQWYSPDKNQFRWAEIQVFPTGQQPPIQEEPKLPIPTSPEFGHDLQFTVHTTVERNSHTEYLIHLQTNIREYYPYLNHWIQRRYNEFKQFHQQLKLYMYDQNIDIRIPDLPEPKVLGRKSKSTVAKRSTAFQTLLSFIASEPRLQTCHLVFEFLNIDPVPNEWKYIGYADEPVRFK